MVDKISNLSASYARPDWLNFIHYSEYKYKIRFVSILRKREDHALISISTILKFSVLDNLVNQTCMRTLYLQGVTLYLQGSLYIYRGHFKFCGQSPNIIFYNTCISVCLVFRNLSFSYIHHSARIMNTFVIITFVFTFSIETVLETSMVLFKNSCSTNG